jgi:hypothetical protein
MINYDGRMERHVKIQLSIEQAESALKRHESSRHPEIQCQCLECLYARELIAQCQVWKEIS